MTVKHLSLVNWNWKLYCQHSQASQIANFVIQRKLLKYYKIVLLFLAAAIGQVQMITFDLCSIHVTLSRKMVVYTGVSIGVFSVLLIGILVGLKILDTGASNTDDKERCMHLDQPCTLNSKASKTPECCSPFICRQTEELGIGNQGQIAGKCLAPAINGTISSTTESPTTTTYKSQCPYSAKLEQILEPVRDGEEFEKTLEFYDEAIEGYLRLTAYRGDPNKNFLLSVRELNSEARQIINAATERVGNNVFPLIVATESSHGLDGIGGTFTLYLKDGSIQSFNPVSEEYEIRKGVSHISLALFGILSPYFQLKYSPGWRQELASFNERIENTLMAVRVTARDASPSDNLSELHRDSLRMLEISYQYIRKWLDQSNPPYEFGAPKTVTVAEFQEYSEEMFPYLESSIRIAAELQVKAVVPMLMKWRRELGEEQWKTVYAVIPTIWPVTAINPRFQALASVMSPEQAKQQIFNFENGGSVEDLRKILGKIVAHRTAAHLIFGSKTQRGKELNFALSGRQDIMSNDADDALKTIIKKLIDNTVE